MIKNITKIFGLDFHIALTLLMRLWTVAAGGVMIIGIPHWFSQAEQGYYFTFNSLLGLQVFFELGFNYVVIQLVGHEVANLSRDKDGHWVGDSEYMDRITSLIQLLQRWYRVIAFLFFIVVSLAGFVFFHRNGEPSVTGWQAAWPLLVLFSAINLYLSPFLAVTEGAGQVGHVARLRLVQSIFGYCLLWYLLNNGGGILVIPVVAAANSICSIVWLFNHGDFIRQFSRRLILNKKNIVNWKTEIFPFQWKIALSWMSGYFIFQIFNPIIFSYQGAAAAGQAGLALSIFSTVLSISMSWVTAKTPVISGHIAREEHRQARDLFWSLFLRSGIVNFIGCAAVLIGAHELYARGFELAKRMPDLKTLLCIAAVTLSNHFIFSAAAYMRAHKTEPLLASSVTVGAFVIIAVYTGAQVSLFVTMLLYAFITIAIGLPWCGFILLGFLKCKSPKNDRTHRTITKHLHSDV